LYDEGHALCLEMSDWFVTPGSGIYDLGSSTGLLTAMLAERHRTNAVTGLDSEPSMVERAASEHQAANLTFVAGDAPHAELRGASYVVAHHLTPFLTAEDRAALLSNVFTALIPGGALMLFEKTQPEDPAQTSIAHSTLHSYKLAQGVRPSEVLAKEKALRGVMRLQTVAQTAAGLRAAGFGSVTSVLRWLNWEGTLAVKGIESNEGIQ